ncbi:glycosyltransferase family 1 protein [Spirosoma sp. SC4-14]|uniref:glycosyltransferase family 4 protein n=1 Tax=Spirosoma sp. SC4-14 TaxID=3128900 RepID=UPI0030CE189D
MNIILDASPLGIGFYHRQARTGISRVVEQLLVGLQRAEDVRLWLAAPTHLAETIRFAETEFGNTAPVFINSAGELALARLENGLLSPFPPGSTVSKAIREVAYRTRRALNREMAHFETSKLPDNAIYHSPFFPIPAAIQQNRHVRTVQTIHDLIPIRHPEWFNDGEQTVKQVLATLSPDSWVTTVSQATKDDFCNYLSSHLDRINPDRVVPIRLAASPALFHRNVDKGRQRAARERFGIGDNPYLLSLATLEPRKNIAHLIRTFGQLVDSNELPADMQLVLVGTKGWKFDELLAEASRSPALKSRLVFTGFVPDEELAPIYTGATAFVYPSLDEGFGLPPLEAMQCGLPVITSNIPSISEIVGQAAIRVSPTDMDDLCQAMITIANSPSLRTELSEKGLKQASLFSWDKFTAEHVALYKRMIE